MFFNSASECRSVTRVLCHDNLLYEILGTSYIQQQQEQK